ncbi:MAG: HD domain-containing protein [Candidatus Paceibacteria bacterium]
MKKISAPKVIAFLEMLHGLQRVVRVMHVPGEDRFENDIEHSYLLAMSVWYAIDVFDIPLDRDKAIRYALAHDMAEVYAGDTYVYSKDTEALATKKTREKDARKKLLDIFPEVPTIHEAMERYEDQSDPESIFVRAFDKVMPLLTNYVQDGRTIKANSVSFSQVVNLKRATTASSPEVSDLLEQIIELIDKDRERFFGELIN